MEISIPKFLLRKGRKKQKPKDLGSVAFGRKKINPYNRWNAEKIKRYGPKHSVMLCDEAPRIGSGFRIVYVKEGRKWAHLVSQPGDPKTNDKIRSKLKLETWRRILARSQEEGC